MNRIHPTVSLRSSRRLLASCLAVLLPTASLAAPYVPCGGAGRAVCVAPAPFAIPTAPKVPGKEHSVLGDRHTGNVPPAPAPGCPPNFGQNVAWDGLGGTDDSFDFEAADTAETDAMANLGDALYPDVIADGAALLFSVDGSPDVIVEPTALAGGAAAGAVWATGPTDVESMCPAADLDALEAWGLDTGGGSDDANRFSRMGDPFDAGLPPTGGRTSVYAHPGATPLCATAALATSMTPLLGLSPVQEAFLAGNMDVDALMVAGGVIQGPDDDPAPGAAPPMMMWSVRPIMIPLDGPFPPVTLDGGEVFVGDCLGTPAAYLIHGGHAWDTVFPVMASFGVPSENVNALEAVGHSPPVPSLGRPALFLLLGMLACVAAACLPRWRGPRHS